MEWAVKSKEHDVILVHRDCIAPRVLYARTVKYIHGHLRHNRDNHEWRAKVIALTMI